jgi:hypothetical protein
MRDFSVCNLDPGQNNLRVPEELEATRGGERFPQRRRGLLTTDPLIHSGINCYDCMEGWRENSGHV